MNEIYDMPVFGDKHVKAWTTGLEKLYITSIGTHSDSTKKLNRLELLKNYMVALSKRHDWTGLAKGEVIKHLANEIKIEQ